MRKNVGPIYLLNYIIQVGRFCCADDWLIGVVKKNCIATESVATEVDGDRTYLWVILGVIGGLVFLGSTVVVVVIAHRRIVDDRNNSNSIDDRIIDNLVSGCLTTPRTKSPLYWRDSQPTLVAPSLLQISLNGIFTIDQSIVRLDVVSNFCFLRYSFDARNSNDRIWRDDW